MNWVRIHCEYVPRIVNAPDGLATYWAYALLITLQGTREETTLRAHTSVVLLYECCWSCISALFECVWRATPQPCLRVVHTGYVMPVAYVMLHTWGAVIACVQFSSFPIVTTLPEGNVGHETSLSTDLGTDPKNSMFFSCPCFCIINAYLCLFTYLVHLFVCAIVFLLRCKPRYIPNGMWRASSLVLFVRTERTSCAKAIWRFTLLTVLRQASFLFVWLVLETQTVVA